MRGPAKIHSIWFLIGLTVVLGVSCKFLKKSSDDEDAEDSGSNVPQSPIVCSAGSPGCQAQPTTTPTPTPPGTPQNFNLTPGDGQVDLSWDAVTGATSYLVYRDTSSGAVLANPAVATLTSWQDDTVSNGTTYYYRVAARNDIGDSDPTAEQSATPLAGIAPPEMVVKFGAATGEDGQVSLSWVAVPGATGYRLFRDTVPAVDTSGAAHASVGAVTAHVDGPAINETTYYYKIIADNAGGGGPESVVASATPWDPADTAVVNNHVFVDDHGGVPCPCNGSIAKPLETIAQGISIVAAGGTVYVMDGSYDIGTTQSITQELHFRSMTGSHHSSAALVTYTGAGYPIDLNVGSDGTSISGIDFENNAVQHMIYLDTVGVDIDNISLIRNRFSNINRSALYKRNSSFTDNLLIHGNDHDDVQDSSDSGAYRLYRVTNLEFSYNTFTNGGIAGIKTETLTTAHIHQNDFSVNGAAGIQVAGASGGVTVEYNTVDGANTSNDADTGAIRLYTSLLTGRVDIRYNRVANSYNGIAIRTAQDVTGKDLHINNNHIEGNSQTGIYHDGPGVLDAVNNYWGSADGPDLQGNPTTGDSILNAQEANITFTPFLATSPTD